MLRWARTLITFFALAAALAGGVTGAVAANVGHPHVGMMMDHSPGGGDLGGCGAPSGLPVCCPVVPFVPLPLPDSVLITRLLSAIAVAMPLIDDLDPRGVRAPPDLRPPIA